MVNHIEYTLGLTRFNFKEINAYQATSLSVRDRLIEQLNDTNEYFNVRRGIYLTNIMMIVAKLKTRVLHVPGVPSGPHAAECTRQH